MNDFFVPDILQEFAFSPPALAIDLGSGESREAVFQATRVAHRFSISPLVYLVCKKAILLICDHMDVYLFFYYCLHTYKQWQTILPFIVRILNHVEVSS